MTTQSITNSINQSPWRLGLILIPLVLACFTLSPTAEAAPPPFAHFGGAPFSSDGDLGNGNTAEGTGALFSLTTGFNNTAMGFEALYRGTTCNDNTAVGWKALFSSNGSNPTNYNTAVGSEALLNDVFGGENTAVGYQALLNNARGGGNTAVGYQALLNNSSGGNNIAIGDYAGERSTGFNNIYIGYLVAGGPGESNTTRIGADQNACYIDGISGIAVTGEAVVVGVDGQLSTTPSSKRFKTEIKPMDKASEAILALKPVTFRYKKDIDPHGTPQFGLVAEQVEKVNADLVARDGDGKIYTVRYDAVNAMLLNEFLKEHRKVEEQSRKVQKQEATIAQLKKGMEVLTASLKEQASQIQKVSAQLEVTKSAPRTVFNSP